MASEVPGPEDIRLDDTWQVVGNWSEKSATLTKRTLCIVIWNHCKDIGVLDALTVPGGAAEEDEEEQDDCDDECEDEDGPAAPEESVQADVMDFIRAAPGLGRVAAAAAPEAPTAPALVEQPSAAPAPALIPLADAEPPEAAAAVVAAVETKQEQDDPLSCLAETPPLCTTLAKMRAPAVPLRATPPKRLVKGQDKMGAGRNKGLAKAKPCGRKPAPPPGMAALASPEMTPAKRKLSGAQCAEFVDLLSA